MNACTLSLPADAPEDFEALCKILMPRTLHDKVDFENAMQVMNWIAVRAHTKDQYDYAGTLGDLVTAYEVANDLRIKFDLTGLDLLKEIVKQSATTQAQLASILGVEQGTVSKIMTGARSITVDHAKRLAKHFKVRAAALLEV
jgi:antitoxin component HigA of HigAB toxin-antitoxin module